MTAPHYYASTSGILVDRALKYGVFPLTYALVAAKSKNHDVGTRTAQAVCFGLAASITGTFLGLESEMIDDSGRKAVAAAAGISPDQLQWSDYKHTNNVIVKKAHDDLMRLQKYRFGTDLLFLLPIALETAYHKTAHHESPATRAIVASIDPRPSAKEYKEYVAGGRKGQLPQSSQYDPNLFSFGEKILQGGTIWAMGVYAAKAGYWLYETFAVQKTGYYDLVKLRENLEATGKDIEANDLKSIYQRTRTDQKLPMVSLNSQVENDALRNLCTRMADAYNKHDGSFGVPEIVYLIGEGKINIHGPDRRTFSQAAYQESQQQIDKVLAIGLDGIRAENHRLRVKGVPIANEEVGVRRTFADQVSNRAINTIQGILNSVRGTPKRPEEYISERDPTNLMGLNGVNR